MALFVLTVIVYLPAIHCDFINMDDPVYVTANSQVQAGLTSESVKQAFSNIVSANWHPITMLSLEMDRQIFGIKPFGFHLTNIILHSFNAMLVFILLIQLTGAQGRSFAVAALFAFHPLHVESVAWISERKDVLSTFFGLLALLSYVKYTKENRALYFWLAMFFFALGLMSKPMLVTLPFLLLLLDFWPLNRFKSGKVVAEKIPFFILAAAFCVMTALIQKSGGGIIENFSFGMRLENALVSYWLYLWKMLWPMNLAIFYPHPGYWPLPVAVVAGAFLIIACILAFMIRKRFPFLTVGWFWFVGTLVPVIGLIQIGEQSMADRYFYIPSIGIFVLFVWGFYELSPRWFGAAMTTLIILCMIITRNQLTFWKNSETLFRHTLAVTKDNWLPHVNLGCALLDAGKTDEAITQFQAALVLNPKAAELHFDLANALLKNGDTGSAIVEFENAIKIKPWYADARINLGVILMNNGRIEEAINQLRKAVQYAPHENYSHLNLGAALLKNGQAAEAAEQFRDVLKINPADVDALNALHQISSPDAWRAISWTFLTRKRTPKSKRACSCACSDWP